MGILVYIYKHLIIGFLGKLKVIDRTDNLLSNYEPNEIPLGT